MEDYVGCWAELWGFIEWRVDFVGEDRNCGLHIGEI